MSPELTLKFRTPHKLSVHFEGRDSNEFNFKSPLSKADQKDIQWYLEIYATSYTTDVDDQQADKIVAKLPQWGQALFKAAFKTPTAIRLYEDFRKAGGHLLNISAKHPLILSLPWELLYSPENTFLCHQAPTISIGRRLGMADTLIQPFVAKPKQGLRVLFVVSRPTDAGFIDPRADAKAVLKALDEETWGRFELEFLRPPTLENLTKRLERRAKYRKWPPIDIIHFDGHGVFQTLNQEASHAKPIAGVKSDIIEAGVKRQMGALQTDLADVLTDMGDYDEAETAYQAALTIATEQDDGRQLGTLVQEGGNFHTTL
ncbi:hypothetical protein PN36_05770 [Candidatus Thiomargarita nelsonii]|uniref:CHAT domain-containing protein n=1 Tax=Candidatus Thiomargarita nelsonii TaxID=1003181 RepID=A0A4E0QS15_9GAMM|nr:hypothetical protein PN36_05770 [Candidatus Thiomargarita nelsonii]